MDASVRRIMGMFEKRKGQCLINVSTQQESAQYLDPDARPNINVTRIVLDFQDGTGHITSIFLHVSHEESGPEIIRISEQND